jgi:hypothetical protein
MTRKHLPPSSASPAELDHNRIRVDQDLDILDAHAAELSAVEHDIQAEMKRTDREYKDTHFHSTPKPIKHKTP